MAEKPEDFSKIEDKFKLSLMQIEKRIVDLEVAHSELSGKVSEPKVQDEDLAQRVDDLEDIAMVENMGVNELKKMLEEIRDNTKPAEAPDMSALEQKIADIENRISSLPQPEKVDLSGVESDTKSLKDTISSINDNHSGLQSEVKFIVNEINSFRREMATEIQEIKTSRPEVAIQFLTSRIESFKIMNDDLQRKLDAMDLKLQELGAGGLEKVFPEDARKKIEGMQKDWLSANSRMDSFESVMKSFHKTTDQLQEDLKKFDTFDKASNLKDDLEKKLEEFKFVETEVKRLSTRIEMVYENIDKRLDKVKDIEKKIPGVLDAVDNISKEIDKNKIEILSRAKKGDIDDLRKFVEEVTDGLTKYSKDGIGKIAKELESIRKENDAKFAEMSRPKDNQSIQQLQKELSSVKQLIGAQDTGDVANRITQLEESIRQNELRIDSVIKDLNEKISSVTMPESPLEEEVKELMERMVFLDTRLAAIEKVMQDTSGVQPIILE